MEGRGEGRGREGGGRGGTGPPQLQNCGCALVKQASVVTNRGSWAI